MLAQIAVSNSKERMQAILKELGLPAYMRFDSKPASYGFTRALYDSRPYSEILNSPTDWFNNYRRTNLGLAKFDDKEEHWKVYVWNDATVGFDFVTTVTDIEEAPAVILVTTRLRLAK